MAGVKAKPKENKISLQEIVGKGYATFWNFKGIECYLQGGKGSKKSKTAALRWIKLLSQYPQACLLVCRKTGATLLESVWADLQWACEVYGITEWKFRRNPISAHNERTGQRIFFRGLDDWQKIASISTGSPNLYLCWVWYEEAFEIDDPATFNRVNNSIRGKLPDGYFKQFVYTYNPWQESNYVVKKLTENLKPNADILERDGKQEKVIRGKYEVEDNRYNGGKAIVETERLYMITNYKLNEFLSNQDRAVYEEMKIKEPTRYKTEGLGMPGVEPGNVFRENMVSFLELYDDAPKLSWKCLSVDATFKKESKTKGRETDYVALQVWGIDDNNHYYLTHRRKKHLSFLETCDEIDELVKLNPDLNAILIEDKANGSAIIEVMRKKYPFVIAVEPKGGKMSRAEAVAPCFEVGTVHLPDRMWINEYIAEFIAFPNGDHDDEIDATSQALMRLMNITMTRLTNEQREKQMKESQEYENLRNDLGLNNSIEDYLESYTSW